MNTLWSTQIQPIGTLYESRALRFSDLFREAYLPAFALPSHPDILEIGCGPGALCEALSRWYPDASVTGLDRDRGFIHFAAGRAAEKFPRLRYLEGDATALPFPDGSFDVTISNTVQEHIPPEAFWGEQYRVLRPGGVCLVLSSRRGYSIPAPCLRELTEAEQKIYDAVLPYDQELNRTAGVGAYATDERGIPLAMEAQGFGQVSTHYVTINLTPDHPAYDRETAHAIINAERRGELDSLDCIRAIAPHLATEETLCELHRIKNQRFDRRIALYDQGIHQWDCYVSVIQITRGVKVG